MFSVLSFSELHQAQLQIRAPCQHGDIFSPTIDGLDLVISCSINETGDLF